MREGADVLHLITYLLHGGHALQHIVQGALAQETARIARLTRVQRHILVNGAITIALGAGITG